MPFSSSLLDPLLCHEEHLELDQDPEQEQIALPSEPINGEETLLELCSSLVAKESDTHPDLPHVFDDSDPYLSSAREESVEWMLRAALRHAFSALTALLAVNYLDRFFLRRCSGERWVHVDKPWARRLAAVACLSLAAKVEETHVPLLVELQLHEEFAGYMFDEKTVRRMELLVLSSLDWRMTPVTPLSFVQILLPSLSSKNGRSDNTVAAIRARLQSCEAILTNVLSDPRWVKYPASVWAAAVLLHTTECDETHDLISLLNVSKEKVAECSLLTEECMGSTGAGVVVLNKRKHWLSFSSLHCTPPPSPDGVIGSCFSYESSLSSGDSWGPEHHGPFKRPHGVDSEIFGDEETREGWGL
ncbi:cyclin-D3-2-like [Typha angustifolia]|uniref:cyclin-D3-2-like n=1 Tax=Typha angustifolia TaxID=59011 RepID=UPI003C2FFC5C